MSSGNSNTSQITNITFSESIPAEKATKSSSLPPTTLNANVKPVLTSDSIISGNLAVASAQEKYETSETMNHSLNTPTPTESSTVLPTTISFVEKENLGGTGKSVLDKRIISRQEFSSADRTDYNIYPGSYFTKEKFSIKKALVDGNVATLIGKNVAENDLMFAKDANAQVLADSLESAKEFFFASQEEDGKKYLYRLILLKANPTKSTLFWPDDYPVKQSFLGSFTAAIKKRADGLITNSETTARAMFKKWNQSFTDNGRFMLIRHELSNLPEWEKNLPLVFETVPPEALYGIWKLESPKISVYTIKNLFGKENSIGVYFQLASGLVAYPQPMSFSDTSTWLTASRDNSHKEQVQIDGKSYEVFFRFEKNMSDEKLLKSVAQKLAEGVKNRVDFRILWRDVLTQEFNGKDTTLRILVTRTRK